jgi:hypothetical protein
MEEIIIEILDRNWESPKEYHERFESAAKAIYMIILEREINDLTSVLYLTMCQKTRDYCINRISEINSEIKNLEG